MRHILLLGSHSTGKTTLGKLLANQLGEKAYLLDGVSRDIQKRGYEINEKGSSDTQWEILRQFMHSLNNIPKGIKTVIHVTSLERVYAYSKYASQSGVGCPTIEFCDLTYLFSIHSLTTLMNYIIYVPIEFELKADGVRSEDISYQKRVDKILRELLNNARQFYYTISGNPICRLKSVLKIINEPDTPIKPMVKK